MITQETIETIFSKAAEDAFKAVIDKGSRDEETRALIAKSAELGKRFGQGMSNEIKKVLAAA